MRDVLNNSTDDEGEKLYPMMPLAGGDYAPWTVLGVQMVLGSDGY